MDNLRRENKKKNLKGGGTFYLFENGSDSGIRHSGGIDPHSTVQRRICTKIKLREKYLLVQQHLLLSFNIGEKKKTKKTADEKKRERGRDSGIRRWFSLPVERSTTYQPLISTTTCHINKV